MLVLVVLVGGSLLFGCGSATQASQSLTPTSGATTTPVAHSTSPSMRSSPGASLISRTASGILIDLNSVTLEGQFILTHFRVSPANSTTASDLGQFGSLGSLGMLPSVNMQLGGLAWLQQFFPVVKAIDPVKNDGYPATPAALQYRTAKAYNVTIPFKLNAAPTDPVTINIARLLFNNPDRNIVNGGWKFTFVPAKIGTKSDAPPISKEKTATHIQLALDLLQRAGLVFPIDKTVAYGGQQVTLLKIACDRDITYLTYHTDDGQPLSPSEIGGHNGKMAFLQPDPAASPILPTFPVSAAPSTIYWVAFSGLPAETRTIYLQFGPGPAGSPPVGLGTPVPSFSHGGPSGPLPQLKPLPVDLSPLATLPQARMIGGEQGQATGYGMHFQAFQIQCGYSMSTIEISANTMNSDQLFEAEKPATPKDALTLVPKVAVDNQPATVVENAIQARDGVATDDLRILNLPKSGTLRIVIGQQYINFVAGRKVEYAKGPWTLSIDLAAVR